MSSKDADKSRAKDKKRRSRKPGPQQDAGVTSTRRRTKAKAKPRPDTPTSSSSKSAKSASKSKSSAKSKLNSLGANMRSQINASLLLAILVRVFLLALVMAGLVLLDLSFIHIDAIRSKPRLALPKTNAKQKIESMAASPKATANDIVSDAISELDGLLAKAREKRTIIQEDTLEAIGNPDSSLRQELMDGSFEVGASGRRMEKIVKCRKKKTSSGGAEEGEDAGENEDEAGDGDGDGDGEEEEGEEFRSGEALPGGGTKCKPGEEAYVIKVEKDVEADEEAMKSSKYGIDPLKLRDIITQAEDEVVTRRGKMGMLNIKDGFDIDGVSRDLGHRFVHILDEPQRKGGKKGGKGLKGAKSIEIIKLPDKSSREMVWGKKEINPKFTEYIKKLKSAGKSFSHFNKKSDYERGLEAAGYKQMKKDKRRLATFVGYEGNECPQFRTISEPQVSFCAQYLPDYKEQEQYQLLLLFGRQNPTVEPKPFDFFPQTWRLYKIAERRALKTRCGNDTLTNEGGPYVTKYTVGGTIGLSLGMWDKIKHSDRSLTMQVKEAKNKAIVQVYVNHPYIYEGRKFIIRSYAIIVSSKPMIVLFHDGALLRSVSKFTPFTKRDGNYHRSSHFTNDLKSNKGPLKSSNIYSSLGWFQKWIDSASLDSPDLVKEVRRQMRAQVIIILYALLRPKLKDYKGPSMLPNNVLVLQPTCFDFLLDHKKKLWFLGTKVGSDCFITFGGNSFRPQWKNQLMKELTDNVVKLGEELMWRKIAKEPVSSMSFYTDTGLDVLIDETFPDWDFEKEIKDHLEGNVIRQVPPERRDTDPEDTEEVEGEEVGDTDIEGETDNVPGPEEAQQDSLDIEAAGDDGAATA